MGNTTVAIPRETIVHPDEPEFSSFGYNNNRSDYIRFILGSHQVERLLNTPSGVTITHLRPGYFYSNLYGFAAMIKGAGFLGANYGGDDRMVLVHPTDIAAAEELTTPGTDRNVRYVASDESTASEIAHHLGVAIGRPDLLIWALQRTAASYARIMNNTGQPPWVP